MTENNKADNILSFSDYSDRKLHSTTASDTSAAAKAAGSGTAGNKPLSMELSAPRPAIAEQIKKYRKAAGLSQKELAEKMNVTRNSVINWEGGKYRPDADLFLPLCHLFGISLYDLFGVEPGSPGAPDTDCFSAHERSLIFQYRMISPLGQRIIDRLIQSTLDEELSEKNRIINASAHGVGIISTKAAAGDGFEYSDIPMEDYRFVFLNSRSRNADAIIQVKGNSMQPVYHEKDRLYVQFTETAETGEDVICSSRAGLHVKRLGEDGPYSVNVKEPFMLTTEDDHVRIIGRVLGIVDADDYPSAAEEEILSEMRKDEIREFREKYQLD